MSDACWLFDGIYLYNSWKAVLLMRNTKAGNAVGDAAAVFSVFKNRMGFIHSRILRAISRYHM